ncbi:hypothetical protein DIPPA_18245 [Diplonema papillatum]|nr:hypothetical protein DIPPA_18245 [Diplonema papillatum]
MAARPGAEGKQRARHAVHPPLEISDVLAQSFDAGNRNLLYLRSCVWKGGDAGRDVPVVLALTRYVFCLCDAAGAVVRVNRYGDVCLLHHTSPAFEPAPSVVFRLSIPEPDIHLSMAPDPSRNPSAFDARELRRLAACVDACKQALTGAALRVAECAAPEVDPAKAGCEPSPVHQRVVEKLGLKRKGPPQLQQQHLGGDFLLASPAATSAVATSDLYPAGSPVRPHGRESIAPLPPAAGSSNGAEHAPVAAAAAAAAPGLRGGKRDNADPGRRRWPAESPVGSHGAGFIAPPPPAAGSFDGVEQPAAAAAAPGLRGGLRDNPGGGGAQRHQGRLHGGDFIAPPPPAAGSFDGGEHAPAAAAAAAAPGLRGGLRGNNTGGGGAERHHRWPAVPPVRSHGGDIIAPPPPAAGPFDSADREPAVATTAPDSRSGNRGGPNGGYPESHRRWTDRDAGVACVPLEKRGEQQTDRSRGAPSLVVTHTAAEAANGTGLGPESQRRGAWGSSPRDPARTSALRTLSDAHRRVPAPTSPWRGPAAQPAAAPSPLRARVADGLDLPVYPAAACGARHVPSASPQAPGWAFASAASLRPTVAPADDDYWVRFVRKWEQRADQGLRG